jgi:hypothetical protein
VFERQERGLPGDVAGIAPLCRVDAADLFARPDGSQAERLRKCPAAHQVLPGRQGGAGPTVVGCVALVLLFGGVGLY